MPAKNRPDNPTSLDTVRKRTSNKILEKPKMKVLLSGLSAVFWKTLFFVSPYILMNTSILGTGRGFVTVTWKRLWKILFVSGVSCSLHGGLQTISQKSGPVGPGHFWEDSSWSFPPVFPVTIRNCKVRISCNTLQNLDIFALWTFPLANPLGWLKSLIRKWLGWQSVGMTWGVASQQIP